MNKALISIVIPVYLAEDCLDELSVRLINTLSTITEKFEILLIDDGSEDNSWRKISNICAQDSRIKGIRFSRNFGQHYAITAGIDICVGEWTVVMDCDLQDRPEDIPSLYYKALEGFDVVLALRINRQDSIFKKVTANIFYRIFSYLTDTKFEGNAGNFRIISRRVVNQLNQMREQLRYFGGMVYWVGFPTTGVPVQHSKRYAGRSTYTISKMTKFAASAIVAYSDKPLRIAMSVGFLMSTFSLIYGSYILYISLIYKTTVTGWASLIVSLFFIGGVIIFTIGVTGLYIGKIFEQTKGRPLYIVRENTFQESQINNLTL